MQCKSDPQNWQRTIRPFLTASLIVLSGVPAVAIEVFGVRLWGEEEATGVEVIDPLPYQVALSIVTDDTTIAENVATTVGIAAQTIGRADQPAQGRAGLVSLANGDYARVLDALYGLGHFGGTVSIQVDGREVDGLALDAALPETPLVVLTVTPGPVYDFGTAGFENKPSTLDAVDLGYRKGLPASAKVIADVAEAGITAWRDLSHPKARVSAVDVVADHRSDTVDVRVRFLPGAPAVVGDVTVTGSDAIDPAFAEFASGLRRGAPVTPKEIASAARRLRQLGTFQVVDFREAEEVNEDGTLPLEIRLSDRKPRRLGAGITLSTLDGLSLEGFWLHRNLARKAQQFRLDAKVAGIGRSIDPGDYDYSLFATVTLPAVLTPDTDFKARVGAERETTDAYDTLALTLETGLETRFSDSLTGGATLINERVRTEDELGLRYFSVTGVRFDLTRDTRDNPLDATKGLYLSASAFPFVEYTGGDTGLQMTGEARGYAVLDRDGDFVLAGRVKAGSLLGIEQEAAPTQTLFYAGGGGSVRGYDFQSIGVPVDGGIVGGRSSVEASGELRMRINDWFGVVGFVDAGHVGLDTRPDFGAEYRQSAGVGLRFQTGLGPIRLDIARGTNRQAGDPEFGLYIGLGQAF